MKLDPDELEVTSFDTESSEVSSILPTNPNEPTPGTFCRICPEGTGDCY